MTNLAGQKEDEATRVAMQELQLARIPVFPLTPKAEDEVQAKVCGKLLTLHGEFKFERRWYYWSVSGPVPLALAERIYRDVASPDIRSGGDCARRPPRTWVEWRTADRDQLLVPLSEKPKLEELVKSMPSFRIPLTYKFVENPEQEGHGFVMTYHIDSALGLRVFVDYITGAYGT
jgi:hypothetical protein